jgi:hypothetical protein
MSTGFGPLCLSMAGLLAASLAYAAAPTARELARSHRWAAQHFRRAQTASPATPSVAEKPGLVVLANHDRVLINERPDGHLLKIADREYAYGLLCHAVSKIVVRLPAPGSTLSATVGVDTHAGGGSVVFRVVVAGREAFRSDVLHCGEPGVPVTVDIVDKAQ